jgi:hypothetical protein
MAKELSVGYYNRLNNAKESFGAASKRVDRYMTIAVLNGAFMTFNLFEGYKVSAALSIGGEIGALCISALEGSKMLQAQRHINDLEILASQVELDLIPPTPDESTM